MSSIAQFRYRVQLQTIDFSTRLWEINYTEYSLWVYSPEPHGDASCLRPNFKISKLGHPSIRSCSSVDRWPARRSANHGFDSQLELRLFLCPTLLLCWCFCFLQLKNLTLLFSDPFSLSDWMSVQREIRKYPINNILQTKISKKQSYNSPGRDADCFQVWMCWACKNDSVIFYGTSPRQVCSLSQWLLLLACARLWMSVPGKQHTYPSPNLTLTVTSRFGQKVRFGEG